MFPTVHPIELLRAVARSRHDPPGELAVEAAWGLSALASEEPAAVLPACRRLLERQPACGPLWWLSARVLTAGDPQAEADRCAGLILEDPTSDVLRRALRLEREGPSLRAVRNGGVGEVAGSDVVIVEASAVGPSSMIVPSSRRAVLQAAQACETPVWIESGVGRLLPPKLYASLVEHLASMHEHGVSDVVVPLDEVAMVVGPSGSLEASEIATVPSDCPEPPELTGGW